MSDSASGPAAGYLFQFEKALLLLANLKNASDRVSIEKFDDVAVSNEDDVVLITSQAKHSISPNGTTFEDTGISLWRTLEIWILKLEDNIFDINTRFVCSTNKKIGEQSLLRKIRDKEFYEVIIDIKTLLTEQEEKLKNRREKNKEAGVSIKKTIDLIKFVLSKPQQFEIIKKNISIQDSEDLKQEFFVSAHLTSDSIPEARREVTFQGMYGWITSSSKYKWLNSLDASFSKKEFDTRLAQINSNPAIVNAVFRKKSVIGSITPEVIEKIKKELFVTQIQDIKRNSDSKSRKIENAVLDFLYHDIEMTHIISKGELTELDFDEFKTSCKERWQSFFDSKVTKDLEEYNEDDKNSISIVIFDSIMDNIEVKFQEGFSFTSSNRYIHNGTFLKLSNIPEIGWHPEWKTKYKVNG